MIAALLSVLVLAAEPENAPPPPPALARTAQAPVLPPHERPVVERQFAAPRPAAAASLSGQEADKLYSLYLSRIGQAPLSTSGSGSGGNFGEGDSQPR